MEESLIVNHGIHCKRKSKLSYKKIINYKTGNMITLFRKLNIYIGCLSTKHCTNGMVTHHPSSSVAGTRASKGGEAPLK